jgi:TolB-like protein
LERRLAAILAADVVGYTRLMGVDEAGTLQRLNELRRRILEPLITEHRGRIVKLVGDGLLVEFVSVVDAVNCALAWQELVSKHEADLSLDTRLRFRIGINLGDVIVEGDDIHGDGVNIAARMEALAGPDEICLSDDAYRQARGKIEAKFVDLGEQNLKNVAFPVRVYRVAGNSDETEPGFLMQAPLALPDKPSIAVLPFTNMSGEADQEYVADGNTEDIITELSRFSGLFVIARNSSFAYKGQSVDVIRVAQELGVRYLLEGSVRRGGNRLRITAQLLDKDGGGHVWGEKYDRDLEDIFELQDEITRSVVSSIAPQIELAELERSRKLSGSSLTAYELALKAQSLSYDAVRVAGPEILDQAESLVDAALALDPRNSHALWTKSLIYFYRHMYRWGDDPDAALKSFAKTAESLVHVDSSNAKAYMVRAWAHLYQRKFDAALADHHRALELNPNLASNLFAMSWTEAISGLVDEAKAHAQMAIRLSPREADIWLGEGYAALALAYFFERDFAEAVKWGQRAYQMQPVLQTLMAAANAYLGDLESARSHAGAIKSFAPDFLNAVLSGEIEVCKLPDHNKLLVDGLREASACLPDEH